MDNCIALTKAGKCCSIEAVYFSNLCHIHEPSLQCGAERKDGKRCNVATGGIRCKFHKNKTKYPTHSQLC